MAGGGPYTEKATGTAEPLDPAGQALAREEAAIGAGQGAAGVGEQVQGMGSDLIGAATQAVDAQAEDAAEQPLFGRRKRGGAGFNPFEGTIMPDQGLMFGPRENVHVANSGSVGPYGGRPIFAAGDTGRMYALEAVANVQNKRARELAKLNEDAKKLRLDEQFEEIARPEYRQNLRQWQRQKLDKDYNAALQLAGSEQELRRKLADPNSLQFKMLMGPGGTVDSINTVVKESNQAFKETQQVIDDMDKGVVEHNPAVYNEAMELLHASGQYGHGDARQLAGKFNGWRTTMNVDKFLKDNNADEVIVRAAGINPETDFDKKSGMFIVTVDQEKRLKEAAQRYAKAAAARPQFRGEKDVEKKILSMLPFENQIMRKVSASRLPGAGKSGGAPQEGKLEFGAGMAPQITMTGGDKARVVPTVTPSEATGGKYMQVAPRDFVDASGTTHRVYGIRFQEMGGKTFIGGRELGADDIIKLRNVSGKQLDPNSAEIAEMAEQYKIGKPIVLDAEHNWPNMKSYFGPDIQQNLEQKFAEARGNNSPVPKTPVASTPPVPGAKLAPDGKYYIPDPKRPGKYLQVQQ